MTDQVQHDLAVVIPAVKAAFFEAALQSVADQSDGRFRLYVFDDASPEDLHEGFQRVCGGMANAVFHRFEENLGRRSLVGQWNRCVRQTREPWVWLFSDDDVAGPDCVAAFHRERTDDRGECDVYRFNTAIIGAGGRPAGATRPHPSRESAGAFTRRWLGGGADCFAVEHVFSRRAFEREGGFVDFPLGWCSDLASWAAFAGPHPIRTVAGPRVLWRRSGANISRPDAANQGAKIEAMFAYADWLEVFLARSPEAGGELARADLKPLLRRWFDGALTHYFVTLPWRDGLRVARRVSRRLGGGTVSLLLGMAGWRLRQRMRSLRASLTRRPPVP